MKYQIYLFDFDYTLANSEKGIVTCFQHVFTQNGFMNIDDEAFHHCDSLQLADLSMTKVKTIGTSVFSNCFSLTFINNHCDNFSVENEALYNVSPDPDIKDIPRYCWLIILMI